MQGSRILIVAVAALAAAAFAVAEPIAAAARRSWHRTVDVVTNIGRWLVARLPRATPDWLGAWRRVRVAAAARIQTFSGAERRRQVSPRWRMCPSV